MDESWWTNRGGRIVAVKLADVCDVRDQGWLLEDRVLPFCLGLSPNMALRVGFARGVEDQGRSVVQEDIMTEDGSDEPIYVDVRIVNACNPTKSSVNNGRLLH